MPLNMHRVTNISECCFKRDPLFRIASVIVSIIFCSLFQHAESGIEDLSLTFTWDEECLGKVGIPLLCL